MEDTSHWRDILATIYGGRDWLLALDILAASTPVARTLDALGAGRMMCVSASRGAGPTPDLERVPIQRVLGVPPVSSSMEAIWTAQAALEDVPRDVRDVVDAWDPAHEALSIGTIYDAGHPVAGRPKFGARAPEWQALEDKLVIDALWGESGVPTAPHAIVELSDAGALERAHAALDFGLGTIWVGDNTSGWHGGAELLRWVRNDDALEDARAFLSQRCVRARVMPFLEGIPCSIHGVVFPEYVMALRPCEMVVLRQRATDTLLYTGTSTLWDPPETRREEMRGYARQVGAHLRKRYGYRGAFSIDGVMTAEGFRPTELNPRYGAALGSITTGVPELAFMLLNLAVTQGVEADWRPEQLEELLVGASDAHRHHRSIAVVAAPITSDTTLSLERTDDGEVVDAGEGDDAPIEVTMGTHPKGGIALVRYDMDRLEAGASGAKLSADVLAHLDGRFGLGLGALEPAKDLGRP